MTDTEGENMSEDKLDDLCRQWSRLNRRMIGLMKPCEDRYGIIFVSHDASANQAAKELAKRLTQSVLTFNFARNAPHKKEWEDKVAFLKDPNAGVFLFKLPPRKPCIIVAGLDRAPDWLVGDLKGLMDHQDVRPFNCLATAASLEPIPDWLSDHFWICRKVGRPKVL